MLSPVRRTNAGALMGNSAPAAVLHLFTTSGTRKHQKYREIHRGHMRIESADQGRRHK
jgi:hypothetical protein